MKVVYSIDVESGNDRCIQNVLRVFEVLSEASRPIAHLIDSMPIGKSDVTSKMTSRILTFLLSQAYTLLLAWRVT